MSPEQALAGIILCAVELLNVGEKEKGTTGNGEQNPSFSRERFDELRGERDSRDEKETEKVSLKVLREAAEAEVGALLERKLEQLREIPNIRRKTPSFMEIEGPDSGADFVRSAAESGCDGGSGMAEVSDFFQRDSRRYDSGFQKY